jgi:hypothetical protein
MNQLQTDLTASRPNGITGSYAVDTSRGGTNMSVSTQWWSRPSDQRFLTLSALRDHVYGSAMASRATVVNTADLEFIAHDNPKTLEQVHELAVGLPDGFRANPTHWSFNQVCALGGAPSSYLRRLPAQIASDALHWSLMRDRRVDCVKSYVNTETGELRAMTGPDYGRIHDYEVVDAVMKMAGNGDGSMGWKVPGVMDWSTSRYNPHVDVTQETTTLFASDRDVFIFLVDDLHPIQIGTLANGEPDLLFRGFYISNSEVGSKTLTIATFYLRGVCCNRILWGVEEFSELKIRHSKNAPDRFMAEAKPALTQFASGSVGTVVAGVEAAKAAKIATDDDEALIWLTKRGHSRKRASTILEAVQTEEGRPMRTVWDAAQGITAVARTIPHQDARMDLEREAGKILDRVTA